MHLPLDEISSTHADEAAGLHDTRLFQVTAPHVNLHALGRLDDRLSAHLKGVAADEDFARRHLEAVLARPRRGATFVAAVWAIEAEQWDGLSRLWEVAQRTTRLGHSVLNAFGWMGPSRLTGLVPELLAHPNAVNRAAGIAVCALHRVDPDLTGRRLLEDRSPRVRAHALRAAGCVGRADLRDACLRALTDPDPRCRFWAAWSAVLAGDRRQALGTLLQAALDRESPRRTQALRLALQACGTAEAHALLETIAAEPADIRVLLHGVGVAGDPAYVPWLLERMTQPGTARLAGEAFTLITGADLDALQLYTVKPAGARGGPTETAADSDVALDPDEGMLWPDAPKVERWWTANRDRFRSGQRYLLGAPITPDHCSTVLRQGYQRQRILAAHDRCLLAPGTPLFNTSAPAWRQQRALGAATTT